MTCVVNIGRCEIIASSSSFLTVTKSFAVESLIKLDNLSEVAGLPFKSFHFPMILN